MREKRERGISMTNREIWQIAREQSAIDSGCRPDDFEKEENCVVRSRCDARARRYLELPFDCDLTSYGRNVVASVSADLEEIVRSFLSRYPAHACFETPALHVLMQALRPLGFDVCFMAEYSLPNLQALRPLPCPVEMRVLQPEDFAPLYRPEWGNALCEKRRQLDKLAVGAYDGEKLVGLAGCSADCDTMWQIGIDVLPAYRRQGIAAALTSRLALETLQRGKVPFYCCAWSNLASLRNALKSGFVPAWVQITVKKQSFIEELNREQEKESPQL